MDVEKIGVFEVQARHHIDMNFVDKVSMNFDSERNPKDFERSMESMSVVGSNLMVVEKVNFEIPFGFEWLNLERKRVVAVGWKILEEVDSGKHLSYFERKT